MTRVGVTGLDTARRVASLIGRGARKLKRIFKARAPRESVATEIAVKPIVDVPFPRIDLIRSANPIPLIMSAPEFALTCDFFTDNPAASRSLVSAASQALIYALIRNLQPEHVVEIGTFRGGTTEAISRALHVNGRGTVHTVGPFDGPLFPPIFAHWPQALKQRVEFYEVASMTFFMEMERRRFHPDLVFVDGNHDYEFALFDIQCAARRLTAGGFILVDNVAQAGPYFAAMDFLRSHPDWLDCGCVPSNRDKTKAFDRHRSNVPGTDFMVLRAPSLLTISERPHSFGDNWWNKSEVRGLALSVDGQQGRGTLHVQCILRGFSDTRLAETFAETSTEIGAGATEVSLTFEPPAAFDDAFAHYSVEPWLIWIGDGALRLRHAPNPL